MARRVRPGMPLPGSEKVVPRSAIAAALGLPSGKPPEPMAPPLSPAQERAKREGKPIPPGDETYERITIAAGRDVLEAFGGEGAASELPVGVEAELGPPKPKPERRSDGEALNAPSPEEEAATAAEEARAMAVEHTRRMAIRTKHVIDYGTPEQKAAAAEEAERSTALVRRVLNKIGGAG
jgi:hypothetical protein